jgi:hypothetical protein
MSDSPSLPSVPSELEAFILGLARAPFSVIKPSIINRGYVTVFDGRTGLDACELTADECFRVLYAETSPAVPISVEGEPTIRFHCHGCSKSVTSPLPPDAILRAIAWCDECIESGKDQDRTAAPAISVEGLEEAMEELEAAYRALVVAHTNPQRDAKVNRHRAARSSLKALFSKLVEGRDAALADVDEMDTNDVLQVLCRVFDDGADQGMDEWLAWYKPEHWFHSARGLGAFIFTRLKPERNELSALRSEISRLSADRPTKAEAAFLYANCRTLVLEHEDAIAHRGIAKLRRLSEQGENET